MINNHYARPLSVERAKCDATLNVGCCHHSFQLLSTETPVISPAGTARLTNELPTGRHYSTSFIHVTVSSQTSCAMIRQRCKRL